MSTHDNPSNVGLESLNLYLGFRKRHWFIQDTGSYFLLIDMESVHGQVRGEEEMTKKDVHELIHSQVRKIKQEYKKIKGQLEQPQVFEIRPVFRKDESRQRSPSPLGQIGREISVGI
ncbi:uncharacterized protein [Typha angustifolia]|uniref:uncharacterized protein n=1 Tax=Typha angustifolia TaxID=59011 RepID=UPI003C2C752C